MKTLKDFIKESQEINESLFGDIVRKLLDTSLSWISGSVKWIANKSADAISDIWKTHRDVLTNTYSEFRRSHPEYNKSLPRTLNTPAEFSAGVISMFYDDNKSTDHKIELANKFIKRTRDDGSGTSIEKGNAIAMLTAQCYVGITHNPKATADDKAKAKNFLQNIKSSVDNYTAGLIDSTIKSLISNI